MSFNDFLLTLFSKNIKLGVDLESTRKHHQIISHIYINIFLLLTASSRDILFWLYNPKASNFNFTIICCLFMLPSLLFLRKGNQDIARNTTMSFLHILHVMGSFSQEVPLAVFIGILRIPSICLLLGFSKRLMVFHILVCLGIFFAAVEQTNQAFKITINDNQSDQVSSLMFSGLLCLFYLSMTSFTQKAFETTLWNLAHANYKKSEDLSKEMIQVSGIKKSYVMSITPEMKNLFKSLDKDVTYLMKEIKDAVYHEVLENIKVKGEVLLNSTNNILDASRLYSNRDESLRKPIKFPNLAKMILMVYSDALKVKNVFAQTYITRNVPSKIMIDTGLLIQIMMNLFSSALNYTLQRGKINIYAIWHPQEAERNVLLLNIKENSIQRTVNVQKKIEVTQINTHDIADNSAELDSPSELNSAEEKLRLRSTSAFHLPGNKGIRKVADIAKMSFRGSQWNIHFNQELFPQYEYSPCSSSSRSIPNQEEAVKGFLKIQMSVVGSCISRQNLDQLIDVSTNEIYTNNISPDNPCIGIWTCKQFCRKLGGDVRITGQEKEEVTYIFYIPIDNTRLASLSSSLLLPKRGKITALVVDDSPYNRNLHKLLLEKNGVEVTVASDGREALETYIQKGGGQYFDFVMSDVQMPIMNGITAGKRIREWEKRHSRTKVEICFVSSENLSLKEVIAELGENGNKDDPLIQYIRKPIDVQILKNIVAKYKVNL